MRPLRVFLCHASQDKPAVRELFNTLKSENWIDPWLDKAKILPGQDWEMVIEKAVDASDVVVVCLSNQSVSKEGFVQREIRYAYDLALEKPEETIFLIPLRLEDCIVPRKLKALHWVDYFGADKDEAYANLLEALRLRYEQKLKAEELERKRQEQKRQEAAELSCQLAEERAAREKAELEAKTEREARLKWEQQLRSEVRPERSRRTDKSENLYEKKVEPKEEKPAARPPLPVGEVKPVAQNNILRYGGLGALALLAISLFGWGAITLGQKLLSPSPTDTPTATETPSLGIGSTMTGSDGMTLLYVPAGNFSMGGTVSLQDNDKPVHTVFLDSYWIDQTEVTNAMYAKCVDANVCQRPSNSSSFTRSNYYGNPEFYDYPVVYVDWCQAKTYCEWAGRRLPTEAEWEKGARGADERIYPWGNDVAFSCEKANDFSSCVGDTSPVGTYKNGKSPYGAYDMAGNVWEWVNDWYDSAYYSNSPLNNPSGPDSGQYRIVRGNAWTDYGFGYAPPAIHRVKFDPSGAINGIGFRCARSP